MSYSLLFVVFCFVLFVCQNWFVGYDLTIPDALAMALIAAFPVVNLLMVIWVVFDTAIYCAPKSITLLRGRK